ncbi:MAG: diguanylate cyclase [Actinobacteria bacterium]|nr:diguanylate cyclase [Actinomycetota bacterium]
MTKYKDLANSITDIFFAFDHELRYTFWNKASENFTGIKSRDAIGKSFGEFFPEYKNTELEIFYNNILKTKKADKYKIRHIFNNKEYYFDIYAYPTKNGISVFARDITNEVLSEIKLHESEHRYKELFDNSPDGIYISTTEGRFTYANPSLAKMLGYDSQKELLNVDISRDLYFSEQERPKSHERDKPVITRLKKKDGSEVWVEIHSHVVKNENGEPIYYQGITRDITERKKNEEELKYQATHDKLTSIYNRFFFEEQMKLISKERNLNVGILVIDVDGLKYINDTLGHHRGDSLLIELTSLLTSTFRPADIIARIGGDEFAIIIRQIDTKTIKELADRLKNKITEHNISLKKHQNPISISIGYAVKDIDTKTLEQTFKQADEMLFREKIPKRDDVRISVLNVLKATMLEKDHNTEEHMARLKEIAVALGRATRLDEHEMKKLTLTTELHDIGKVIIPEHILNKKGVLTQKEYEIVKKHTEAGYRIAKATPEISDIANYILHSHERWDGQGYPKGLGGDEIPLISRMVFIIDSYDAMTDNRPYSVAMPMKAAIEELKKNAGTQFDPYLVKIFINKILPKKIDLIVHNQ